MSGETRLTVTGNLVEDPELRFTPSGAAWVTLRVASTPRSKDRDSGEWRDGETLFLRCTAWRALAENVAATLRRGDRVTVTGALGQKSYEDREGNKRTSYELQADDISASLAFATAVLTKSGAGRRVAAVPDPAASAAS